jgi:hypothetical protein
MLFWWVLVLESVKHWLIKRKPFARHLALFVSNNLCLILFFPDVYSAESSAYNNPFLRNKVFKISAIFYAVIGAISAPTN